MGRNNSSNKSDKIAHYRDHHNALKHIPKESMKHGWKTRMQKTDQKDLQLHAAQRPLRTVFASFSDAEPPVEPHLSNLNNGAPVPVSPKLERKAKMAELDYSKYSVPISTRGYSGGGEGYWVAPEINTTTQQWSGLQSPHDSDNTPTSATYPRQMDYPPYNAFERIQGAHVVDYVEPLVYATPPVPQPEPYMQAFGQHDLWMASNQSAAAVSPISDDGTFFNGHGHFHLEDDHQQFSTTEPSDPRFAAIAGLSSIGLDPVAPLDSLQVQPTADHNDPAYCQYDIVALQGPMYYARNY